MYLVTWLWYYSIKYEKRGSSIYVLGYYSCDIIRFQKKMVKYKIMETENLCRIVGDTSSCGAGECAIYIHIYIN